jgi:hypothetical protein
MYTRLTFQALIFFLLLTSHLDVFSQKNKDFSGTIVYKIEYFTKDGQLITDRKLRTLGDTSISYIKKGNYRIEYPHSRVEKVIYLYENAEYYAMFRRYDTIFVYNYKIPSSPIKSYGKIDTTTNVLGYKCRGYKVTTNSNSILYFYTDSLHLNPEYFKDHTESGYNYYSKDTKAIYLKLILSYSTYDLVLTAVKVTDEKIDDEIFIIPPRPLKYK